MSGANYGAALFKSVGKISWDYEIYSVPVYAYEESTASIQFGFEVLNIILLGLNIVLEVIGEQQSSSSPSMRTGNS